MDHVVRRGRHGIRKDTTDTERVAVPWRPAMRGAVRKRDTSRLFALCFSDKIMIDRTKRSAKFWQKK
jgi:hypothetical protein